MKFLYQIGAIGLIILGSLVSLGTFIGIAEGTSRYSLVTDLVMMSFVGFGSIGLGVWSLSNQQKKLQQTKTNEEERLILSLAGRLGGKITVVEITQHTSIRSEKAQKILEKFQRIGLADLWVSETGTIIYEIKSLNSGEDKQNLEKV